MAEFDKNKLPSKLLWVDLEMTGLDASSDVIIEVAALVTNFDFDKLASYEAVIYQPEEKLAGMNEWSRIQHGKSGLLDRVKTEGKPEKEVEADLAEIIKAQFGDEPAILAGNSIHQDRKFVQNYWPEVEALLHYRMLDVSAFKIIMQGKYGEEFEKKETHRALSDIEESIAELQYYLDRLKK